MSLVTDRGGHLEIFAFCEFFHNEENNIEKLGSEGKFNRKTIIFTARTDDIIKMKSIGDVGVDDIKSDVAYVKEKEKQAQIVVPETKKKKKIVKLQCLYHPSFIIQCRH
jgi:hypothetical protein